MLDGVFSTIPLRVGSYLESYKPFLENGLLSPVGSRSPGLDEKRKGAAKMECARWDSLLWTATFGREHQDQGMLTAGRAPNTAATGTTTQSGLAEPFLELV